MGAVSTPLVDEARSVFEELGYDVTHNGEELLATRKWREVYVTTEEPGDAPTHGRLRCFVTDADRARTVRERLRDLKPPYDWAVVALDGDGYEVLHADDLTAP